MVSDFNASSGDEIDDEAVAAGTAMLGDAAENGRSTLSLLQRPRSMFSIRASAAVDVLSSALMVTKSDFMAAMSVSRADKRSSNPTTASVPKTLSVCF